MNSPTYLPGIDQIPRRRDKVKKATNGTALFLAVVISALLPLWRTLNFVSSPSNTLYYGAFGVLAVMTLLTGRNRVQWSVVWLLCWCAASIMLNTFSAYFTPWPRLMGLALIIVAVGPLLGNHKLLAWRQTALTFLLWGCVVIAVVSFVMYYVARPLTMHRGFLFMGITGNSMLISPMAYIGALFLIQWTMRRNRNLGPWVRVLLWTMVAVCVFAGILSGSRSALIGFLVAFTVWMWLYLRSVKKFVMIAAALGVVVLATAPAWTNYTDTLEDKMAANEKTGGFLTARQALWEQRWKEFKKEPGFGVGFSKVERTTEDEDTSKFKIGSGMVEPGNGWLFVLSSTGIGGFALLLWIYLKTLCKLFRLRRFEAWLTLSLLVYIGVHSFAEGYIFSAGNFFCLVFWLCLGLGWAMPRPAHKLTSRP